MAWTGTPVVTSLGKNIARITGVSLAAAAGGTIKASGGGANLPSGHPGVSDSSIVIVNHAAAPAAGTPVMSVVKSGTPTDTITVTNHDGTNATGVLEIWVIAPHSLIS
jgi:hypothetical protein